MPALFRTVIFIALMLSIVALASAHALLQSREPKEPTGTVSGRVTIGGKPAQKVVVMLLLYESFSMGQAAVKGSTDEEGRYRLTRVPAGRYYVRPFAPAFVSDTEGSPSESEKTITLSEGETVEGINIALKRGGVITGRITDANGRPVIEEEIGLRLITTGNQNQTFYPSNYYSLHTDDRGVYRLYGLPAGRYLVSVGMQSERDRMRMGFGSRYYPLTFHPGVMDESKATVVELSQGGEVTGVDIILSRVEKSYSATGRVVDADTGKPVADISYGYAPLMGEQRMFGIRGWGHRSGPKGEITMENLLPGRYAVLITPGEGIEFYNDPTTFEVVDADVSGVEMKIHRGASITGTLVVEGANPQDVSAKLTMLNLYLMIQTKEINYMGGARAKISPDGSFRASGLWPGKAVFRLSNWGSNKDLTLMRIERDGLELRDGVEISAAEQISGVKLILGQSTGVIRGQIKIENMNYPEDAQIEVRILRAGANTPENLYTVVDSRGHFVVEGVVPGDYELSAEGSIGRSKGSQVQLKRATQVVTVTNGTESEVTLVLKTNAKDN